MVLKRLINICLGIAACLSAAGQLTPRSAFTAAPMEMFPTLPQSIRLDMLDYFDSGISRPSDNLMGAPSIITEMTDTLMTMQIGKVQRVTLVTLPLSKEGVIMVIDRLDTPDTDACIRFYNSRWEPLEGASLFREPTLADFTGKISKQERAQLESTLQFLMYDAQYDPREMTLTLTPQTGGYVAQEGRELVDRLLGKSVVYHWNGKRFNL